MHPSLLLARTKSTKEGAVAGGPNRGPAQADQVSRKAPLLSRAMSAGKGAQYKQTELVCVLAGIACQAGGKMAGQGWKATLSKVNAYLQRCSSWVSTELAGAERVMVVMGNESAGAIWMGRAPSSHLMPRMPEQTWTRL